LAEAGDYGPHVGLLRLRELERDFPFQAKSCIYLCQRLVDCAYLWYEQALYRRIEAIDSALGEVLYPLHGPLLDSYPGLPGVDRLLGQFEDYLPDLLDCLGRDPVP